MYGDYPENILGRTRILKNALSQLEFGERPTHATGLVHDTIVT